MIFSLAVWMTFSVRPCKQHREHPLIAMFFKIEIKVKNYATKKAGYRTESLKIFVIIKTYTIKTCQNLICQILIVINLYIIFENLRSLGCQNRSLALLLSRPTSYEQMLYE